MVKYNRASIFYCGILERRAFKLGITNTVMGAAALFPARGGVMADFVHFNGVFAAASLMVLGSLVMSLRLKRVRN